MLLWRVCSEVDAVVKFRRPFLSMDNPLAARHVHTVTEWWPIEFCPFNLGDLHRHLVRLFKPIYGTYNGSECVIGFIFTDEVLDERS